MFNSKKKRAAKLEAEKEAARKIMEEAGLDLGHEAAKVATKSTKGALLPIAPELHALLPGIPLLPVISH
eukprot:COSAG02_NODE_2713_length_8180_cov_268.374706_2_plen_69_part_00